MVCISHSECCSPSKVASLIHECPLQGNTLVRVELNYLDPDHAPYYVVCDNLASCSGQPLPCTILAGRVITFRAPAHPKGCVPLTIMCEQHCGSLRCAAEGSRRVVVRGRDV